MSVDTHKYRCKLLAAPFLCRMSDVQYTRRAKSNDKMLRWALESKTRAIVGAIDAVSSHTDDPMVRVTECVDCVNFDLRRSRGYLNAPQSVCWWGNSVHMN